MSSRTHILAAAALLATLAPASALAQDTLNETDSTTLDSPLRDDRDDDFPWGLLGLLGLAGLLGLKRNDRDVHVDRTDPNRRT